MDKSLSLAKEPHKFGSFITSHLVSSRLHLLMICPLLLYLNVSLLLDSFWGFFQGHEQIHFNRSVLSTHCYLFSQSHPP